MWYYDQLEIGLGNTRRGPRRPMPPDDYQVINIRLMRRKDVDEERRDERQIAAEPAEPPPAAVQTMKITQSAYGEILEYFRFRHPEAAGILIGPAKDDPVVTHFVADEDGDGTAVSFRVNADALNRVLERVKPAGLDAKGIIHSHPAGITQPSAGDLAYVRRLFRLPANAAAQQCFLPIYCDRRIHPYVFADDEIWPANLLVI